MKLSRISAALIAAATAFTPLSSNAPAFTPAIVNAETSSAGAELPDWVPTDFRSALGFRNTYGTTHIGDGLICLVFLEEKEEIPEGELRGMLRYMITPTKGNTRLLKDSIYDSEDGRYEYEVVVYDPVKQGEFNVTFIDTWVNGNDYAASYTFSIDDDLNVAETDIYSWLPDCETEYKDYVEKHGSISVRDNYVVFCKDSTVGIPLLWQERSQDYFGNFEYRKFSLCSPETEVPLEGGAIYEISVYQAVRDGHAKIEWEYIPDCVWELDPPFSEDDLKAPMIADCVILDDAQTILLSDDARITLVDYDTKEKINIAGDSGITLYEIVNSMEKPVIGNIVSNPCILRGVYHTFDGGVGLDMPYGYEKPMIEGTYLTAEDYMTVTTYDNGSADVVFGLKKKNEIGKSTRITFYDKDTGELLNVLQGLEGLTLYKEEAEEPYEEKAFDITSNPYTFDSGDIYDPSCNYCIGFYNKAGRYDDPEFEIVSETADRIDVVCRSKWKPSGDINGDYWLNIADVTLMQKWLLGNTDVKIYDWRTVDFCRDGKIDSFDLSLMRREVIKTRIGLFLEPDVYSGYHPIRVLEDGLKMYLGPDESYGYDERISIPKGTQLNEDGYQNGNDKWIFTSYGSRNGWIRTVKEDDTTPTIMYETIMAKPVIYLYPEQETDVHVELELTEAELSTTYPRYDNGWDVTAYPDGTLLNKADGTHHKYLFWDAVNCSTRFDFSKGFCVAGSDTESFLKEKLTYMGLTEEEMNEFIVYWLPRMEHNAYNLISFQGDTYTNSAKLDITPAPDSMLRIFMTYVPLEKAVDIEPQQLETFERKGFTVVEWGGSEIRS